jgi:hypothetical protein
LAKSIFTDALEKAVKAEGSPQAVASALRVSEPTLARWIRGRAQMPIEAFLKTLELVSRYEAARRVPDASLGEPDEKLRFAIGHAAAHCVRCDGAEFRRADPEAQLKYVSKLACRTCGTEVVHGDLIVGLAKEVSHSAAARVVRSRRKTT